MKPPAIRPALLGFTLIAYVTAGSSTMPAPVHGLGLKASRPAGSIQTPKPPTAAECRRRLGYACYSPRQLQTAYDLKPLLAHGTDGRGVTVAVIIQFGSPTIRHDLAVFDRAFGLPAPPSLRIIAPAGKVPAWKPRGAWMSLSARETSIDVEAVHAMAPGAGLLLVETPVAETIGKVGFPQIVRAETYVIRHHLASVISQSFGTGEPTFRSRGQLLALRSAYRLAHRRHVTVLAGSGDWGATSPSRLGTNFRHWRYFTRRVANWPASDPLVTAVGGTHLTINASGARTAPDRVWNSRFQFAPQAAGGTVSATFRRPLYQRSVKSTVGAWRGVPDVSMDADNQGGLLVYEGFRAPGHRPQYYSEGGTSLACPLFAGIVALADQAAGHPLGLLNPALYRLGSGSVALPDVRRGDNNVRFVQGRRIVTVKGYRAVSGYDLATGLGTIDAAQLVNALATRARSG